MDVRDEEFGAFVAGRSTALLRTAFLLTGDRHGAEDLLQTALAKTYLAWSGIRAETGPEAYVRRVLVTTNVSWWRARRRLPVRTAADLVLDTVQGSGTAEIDERLSLWEVLRALPSRQRTVIVLRYYEDRSEAETAVLMGCSVGTVKSYHARALKTLRLRMTSTATSGGGQPWTT